MRNALLMYELRSTMTTLRSCIACGAMQGDMIPACHHRVCFLHSLQEGNPTLEAPATSPRLSGLHSLCGMRFFRLLRR